MSKNYLYTSGHRELLQTLNIRQWLLGLLILAMNMAAMGQTPFYGKVPGINENARPVFWYGTVNSTQMASLKTFDLVVLEPTLRVVNVGRNEFYMESLTSSQVEELKRGVDGITGTADDVIVLGYISIGEMLSTIIPGSSGHMTVQKGIDLGLLPVGYSGPSGPVKGPNPWDFTSSGAYIDTEQSGVNPDGTYDDGFQGYSQLNISGDYSGWGSRVKWRNQGVMPWYMDQQGTWVTDSRYIYGGFWKSGDNIVDINPTYGGGYINAGDPAWRKFIEFQIDKLVHDCGFDGVFLDTYDTPDPVGGAGPSISWGPRGNFAWTAKGMVELVEMIKAVDPSKVVASNRGYWMMNPQEGTSQFADRYRQAMNIFVTESWYHNPYITSGSMFYDENPAFAGNWNTNPASPDYQIRDNFGGYWKDYMDAQSNATNGFNILIIDFLVTSGAKINKWMGEVVDNSGYLGYAVHNSTHFNSGISTVAKDWLDGQGRPSANLQGFHTNSPYSGFAADGNFSEWNSETPIFNDPSGSNGKSITKVFVKFINDRFFMMVESNTTLNLTAEHIYFDFDQNGPSGWDVFWPVSPDAKIYLETEQQVNLYPHRGPGDVFAFPNAITNRGWPVKTAKSTNRYEFQFEKDFIFGPVNQNKEVWTWFRVANFGGTSIQFNVPADGPALTSIEATSISDNSQNISWQTNVPASSRVEYGPTTSYGSNVTNSTLKTSHSLNINGLAAGTTYHYKVISTDADNKTSQSGDRTFTTTDANAPAVITNIQATGITRNNGIITWTTDQNSSSLVNYGLTTGYGQNASASGNVTAHTVNLSGLVAGTTYNFRVNSTNAQNVTATSGNNTFTTLPNLSISNVAATPTNVSATITWTSNTPSDSKVDYGLTSGYGSTVSNATLTTSHSVTLTGLTPGTLYHYKVTSNDGQTASSNDLTFTTSTFSSITVDGNTSDWAGVPAVATSGSDLTSLKVAEGQNHIYVLVEGTGINAHIRRLMINADNNGSTGMAPYNSWSASGIDYMIESELQYQSTGSGWSWSGMSNTHISVVVTASVYEISILKSSLTNLEIPFKIGFTLDNTFAQLPQGATDMATYNGSGGGTVAVTGVGVNPTSATLNVSGTQQLTATLAPSNATNQNVTWSSNNTSVASVSSSGLVSANAAGSAIITVTTQDGGFTATSNITVNTGVPNAPSGLSSSAISASQINLSWMDNSSNESGFRIERKTGAGGTYSEIATVGAGVTTYNNTGLSASTAYYYRVWAYNGSGNSAYSNETNTTTQSGGGGTSITIDGNTGDWSGISSISTNGSGGPTVLKAADDTNNLYVLVTGTIDTYYGIFIDTDNSTTSGGNEYLGTDWPSTGFDYMVENGTLYSHTGQGSGWSWTNLGTVNVVKSGAAIELAVSKSSLGSLASTIRIGAKMINSGWAPSGYIPVSGGTAAAYVMGGSSTVSVTGVSVSPTTGTLNIGGTQQLTATVTPSNATNQVVTWSSGNTSVASVNSSGLVTTNAGGSAIITVTTQDGGFTATCNVTVNPVPNPPSALSASAVSVSQINLSWTDNSNNETGFRIERKTGAGGTYAEMATAGVGATTYNNTGLSEGTTYYYRIRSYNASGNSAYSNEVNATTSTSGGGSWTQISSENFETGWGIWNDGGSDASRYTGGTFAHQGSAALDIQDNTSTSVVTTNSLDLSAYDEVKVDFWFMSVSMESGEDFWLQISTNGGSSFTTVESWAQGTDFSNNAFTSASVIISSVTLTANTQLRFRCDASNDSDDIYIDEVVISGSGAGGGTNIIIDGNTGDWSSIANISTSGSGGPTALKAADDTQYLYVLVTGTIDANYEIFIDTDNSTTAGSNEYVFTDWPSTGFDFMVENGVLYAHIGQGSGWSWTNLGTINVVKNGAAIELAVSKSSLGSLTSTVRLAGKMINSGWSPSGYIPVTGGSAAPYVLGSSGSRIAGSEPQTPQPKINYSVYPNPSGGEINIRFTLDESSRVDVLVYDLSGHERSYVQNRRLMAGEHQLSLNTSEELAAGMYLVKMVVDGQVVLNEQVRIRK